MSPSNYPRVTHIIDETNPPEKKKALIRWMKKLEKIHGIEGAQLERQKILDNGTDFHTSVEKYLQDIPDSQPHKTLGIIRPVLKMLKNANPTGAGLIIEKRVFCHTYKYQGKPDLVCANFQGQSAIIDWTTSSRRKIKKYVEHKFLQAGAYALAYRLELGITVEKLAVVVVEPNRYEVFKDEPQKWSQQFLKRLEQYYASTKI